MNGNTHALAAALLLLSTNPAWSQTSCKAPSPDCVTIGDFSLSVSLGLGVRTNPVMTGRDIPLLLVPHLHYYGDRFFIEDLELGVTLHESDSHTINLVAAPGYDRVFFVSSDAQNVFADGGSSSPPVGPPPPPPPTPPPPEPEPLKIPHRKTTYLAGPEWNFSVAGWTGQLSALYDVTGVHGGYEVRAAAALPVRNVKGATLSAGLTWKSAETVDYYYGVPGEYEPGAALNPFVKVGYTRELSDRLTIRGFLHFEKLGGTITDSPYVGEDHVVTVFAGVDYRIL